MSQINRSRPVVVLAALLFSVACTSTSTRAPETDVLKKSAPLLETKDSTGVATSEASALLAPVYFDTDRAVLRADARNSLRRYAKSILDHPEWGVVAIDGHCDERGSSQYNMALGGKRAAVVERYLAARGVPPSRLVSRTFGAARPAVPGHNEGAWRYNRRSELRIEALASASL